MLNEQLPFNFDIKTITSESLRSSHNQNLEELAHYVLRTNNVTNLDIILANYFRDEKKKYWFDGKAL